MYMFGRRCFAAAVIQAALLCTLTAMLGCTKDEGSSAGTKGSSSVQYDSPDAVFAAAKKFIESEDYAQLVSCYTKETIDTMAGTLAYSTSIMKSMQEQLKQISSADKHKKLTAQFETMEKIVTKYGATPEKFAQLLPENPVKTSPDKQRDIILSVAKLIDDRVGFVGEMMKASMEMSEGRSPNELLSAASLSEVEINGDVATGKLVSAIGDQQQQVPIEFHKENGGWLMHQPN